MPIRFESRQFVSPLIYLLKWTALLLPVCFAIGGACAFFLWSLDEVTRLHRAFPWLLYFLPVAGAFVGAIYLWIGKGSEAGNNLIIDQIHAPAGGVPKRMAPLVLFGTLVTHLFGGSAGREGTAVQMGGSIASGFRDVFRLNEQDTRTLLMCGVAAGFGAVFGTPLAGAIFAIEVLAIGRMEYSALIPCLIAAFLGDWSCLWWGAHHTHYSVSTAEVSALNGWLLAKVVCASLLFGVAARLFANCAHGFQAVYKRFVPSPVLRPFVGGLIVMGLVFAVGSRDYLGLGVSSPDPNAVTIVSSFQPGGTETLSWFWKLLFTCVTVSAGFKGGEVTPLFFVGAALGNTLAVIFNAPVDLFAAIGFVAVFAGAANTPLACSIMAVELFGHTYAVYFALASFVAYAVSGDKGIYAAQRREAGKHGRPLE